MHARGFLFALLVAVLSSATAFAKDEQRNRWQIEGWYGYDTFTDGAFFSCNAAFDYGQKLELRLGRIRAQPVSSFELWDMNDGTDLMAVADIGTSVTVTVGNTQRVYKVDDSYSMMLSVLPQPGIIPLIAAGGPVSFKLPNGKVYSTTLPPAPTAMANYRRCMERNQVPVN